VKENDAVNQKQIHRLEQQLQAAKVKLSVARRNNQVLRAKVDQLRKEKLMQLKILDGLVSTDDDRSVVHILPSPIIPFLVFRL
jgi:hypothetical protein